MSTLTRTVPAVRPRVLLSIDYEPWFAFIRRYDAITDSAVRKDLDAGFSLAALDGILAQLAGVQASFYLVGEVADWYPRIPERILAAGHELGLHCQVHRPLVQDAELEKDLRATESWRHRFGVRGYRAPMVGIRESGYALLSSAGFRYSSSIYAPSGSLLQKHGVWELPVSTRRIFGRRGRSFTAPRHFSMDLVLGGEIPFGSSFTIGLLGDAVFRFVERDLAEGASPILILHPYELVRPERFVRRTAVDLLRHPLLLPFVRDKSGFLGRLVRRFPVSSLGAYLDEVLSLEGGPDD